MDIIYPFNWSVIDIYKGQFLVGALNTIVISIISLAAGFVIGYIFSSIKSHKIKVLSGLITAYVEVIRNTPFLVQVYVIYFALPLLVNIRIDPLIAGVIALSLNCGGFTTEIIRGGMDSIDQGQIDSGLSIGMNRLGILRYVITYPVLQKMFPAISTLFILTMLGSSVLSAISVPDLTGTANAISARVYHHFEIFVFIAVIYLFLSIVLSTIFKIIEIIFLSREKISTTRITMKNFKDVFRIIKI